MRSAASRELTTPVVVGRRRVSDASLRPAAWACTPSRPDRIASSVAWVGMRPLLMQSVGLSMGLAMRARYGGEASRGFSEDLGQHSGCSKTRP